MKIVLKALTLAAMMASTVAMSSPALTGAGSSFIYPVMSRWAYQYANDHGAAINYQPIGSGGGIRQIFDHTVEFAATDVPLTMQVLKQKKLYQFPMISGGIVPVVHLTGVANNTLVLSGPVLAKIYLGQIKNWNDPQIKALNPKYNLPNAPILLVYRADGSGTTYNFTHYLTQVSATWAHQVGFNTSVKWPAMGIGAKGNAGVAVQVQNLPNSIGYVEYSYARDNHLLMTKMKNAANQVVQANPPSFKAAAKSAHWTASNGYGQLLTNAKGDASWPIVATTYVLVPKGKQYQASSDLVLKFFKWCYTTQAASDMAVKLGYVGLPKSVSSQIIKSWSIK